MGKPYSMDLRERVVKAIEAGETRESAALRYEISLSTVGRYIRLWREKGSVDHGKFGGHKIHALSGHEDLIRGWIAENPSLTLNEMGDRLKARKIKAGQTAIFNFLRHLDLPYKKNSARRRAGAG